MRRGHILVLCVLLELFVFGSAIKFPIRPVDNDDVSLYHVGTGIADITGPAAESNSRFIALLIFNKSE